MSAPSLIETYLPLLNWELSHLLTHSLSVSLISSLPLHLSLFLFANSEFGKSEDPLLRDDFNHFIYLLYQC